jgi:hypothetical protein
MIKCEISGLQSRLIEFVGGMMIDQYKTRRKTCNFDEYSSYSSSIPPLDLIMYLYNCFLKDEQKSDALLHEEKIVSYFQYYNNINTTLVNLHKSNVTLKKWDEFSIYIKKIIDYIPPSTILQIVD